jgi:hypothetical protein
MRKKVALAVTAVTVSLILAGHAMRISKAQDAPAPATAVAAPTEVVDQIMGLIGQGRIDDGVAMMEGLKNQPDLRQAARDRLIHLRDEEGAYRGYDVAAIQRFTNQFEIMDVLAYYDDQPVLFRFHFYRPQTTENAKWMVLGFQATTSTQEITDVLKDTPVDYVGRAKH